MGMSLADLAQVGGVVLVGLGLIATWLRNGRQQRQRDEKIAKDQREKYHAIKSDQMNILKRLDDPDQGLSAINKCANAMQKHCAEVSTRLSGRLDTAERDIKEIKKRVNF